MTQNFSPDQFQSFWPLTYSLPEQMRNGKMERWLDSDDAETRRYIEKEYGFHSPKSAMMLCGFVFAKNQYHPIRDLVDSFGNGTGTHTTFSFCIPGQSEDTAYTREVSRFWRFIFSPGAEIF